MLLLAKSIQSLLSPHPSFVYSTTHGERRAGESHVRRSVVIGSKDLVKYPKSGSRHLQHLLLNVT